jgi:hypothetical protein
MATRRYYSANAVDGTVSAAINSSASSVTLTSNPVGFPGYTPYVVALDYNTSSEELVLVTGQSGNTLNITRGFNGTSPTAHNPGAVVRHVITAQDLTDYQDHAAASTNVHGITGPLVGTNDNQTLTNKSISGSSNTITNVPISTGISGLGSNVATFLATPSSANLAAAMSDETGSGPIVFATGPTLSSPVITGTINASGSTGPSGTFLQSTGSGVAWASAAQNPSYTLINSTDFAGTNASTITFNGLSGYNKYIMICAGLYSSTGGQINITINGDTGANYKYWSAAPVINSNFNNNGYFSASPNSFGNQTWSNISIIGLGDYGSGVGVSTNLYIDGANSSGKKFISGTGQGYAYAYPAYLPSTGVFGGVWNGTATVSSLTVTKNATMTSGTVYLYGSN